MADKEFAGSALYAEWIYSGGTLVLSTENRNFTYAESGESIDATAGSDSTRRKLPSYKSSVTSMNYTAQTDGTLLLSALAFGTRGTLIFGEAGTVTGSPKTTLPCFSLGVSRSVPYADVVTYDLSWEATGDPIFGAY